ncbi:MAG: hypothetical protein GY820_38760 [Gammaproteobacteria bacterium]|nr:hypothetical protein [Gammaproteobacteria bacterium]
MTFVNLAKKIRVKFDAAVDRVAVLRDAENDFIERTLCTETFTELDTSALNSGVLTNLYDCPSGFLKEHRVEWDGILLKPYPQSGDIAIYNRSNELLTGTPCYYWIENEDIHLVPKPSSHSKIGLWYSGYNTDSASASPTIPTIEQNKLINYAVAQLLEMDGQEDRAVYYQGKYNADVTDTARKYDKQRFKQGRIIDVTSTDYGRRGPGGEASVTVVETNIVNNFTWKRVQLSNTTDVPPTEETFTAGAGVLSSGALDSAQSAIPKFSSTNSFAVEITAAHQDRGCFVSTAPTVSGTTVSFGLTLSEAGVYGDCYFDVTLKQLS